MQRMDDMGRDMEKSNLYLKLFKLVFGSVTLFAQENELMLKVRTYMQVKVFVEFVSHFVSVCLCCTKQSTCANCM